MSPEMLAAVVQVLTDRAKAVKRGAGRGR